MKRQLTPEVTIGVLGRLIGSAGAMTSEVGGRIAFRVRGDRGGTWVVDLDRAGGSWSRAFGDPRATATIDATEEALFSLVAAPDRLARHSSRGELSVSGDRSKLTALGRLLATSSGGAGRSRAHRPSVCEPRSGQLNGRNR